MFFHSCFSHPKVHSFMYSFIPFISLTVINILLIFDLHKRSRTIMDSVNSTFKKNQISISVSVVLMTLLFVFFTCPSAVASQYYDTLVSTYTGNIVLFAADCFAFSYHALNIIILILSNKQFDRKFQLALGLGKTLRPIQSTTGNSLTLNNRANTQLNITYPNERKF